MSNSKFNVKKKKELLYYYIISYTKLDPNEITIDIDFSFVNQEILDSYVVIVKYDTFCDPDIDTIFKKIKMVSSKIEEALNQVIFNTKFNLVSQNSTDVNISDNVMGSSLITDLTYKWSEDESLFTEIHYFVEALEEKK